MPNGDINFTELQKLLYSEQWPHAVDPFFICKTDSENDKIERAEGILDLMVEESLDEKKFLDFGCGEGHVAHAAKKQLPSISVGYDIKTPATSAYKWEESCDGMLLTSSFERVQEHAPFDVILLYDVIDHSAQSLLPSILQQVLSVSKSGTRIYIRCHPWTCRHAGHLYQKLNKAFVHLIFSSDELALLGIPSDLQTPAMEVNPLRHYRAYLKPKRMQWFPFVRLRYQPKAWMHGVLTNLYRNCFQDQSLTGIINYLSNRGIKYSARRVHRVPVEKFFLDQKLIRNRLNRHVGYSYSSHLLSKLLEQSFIDYVITVP